MYKKFEALSDEKRMRIINSSFNEFAGKQFKEASTDEIAKNAEISKGALFQYFGTKKQLYLYVHNYAYDILLKEFWGQIDISNPDLLERLKDIFAVKMNLYCKYPNLFKFIVNAFARETDKDIKELTNKELSVQRPDVYAKVLTGIDYSKFREEFDPDHIISIISWTMEGYSNSEIAKLQKDDLSIDKYRHWMIELDQYIGTLKRAFYKEDDQYAKRN
jgi:AcrR family transcriptional regulator